MPIIEAVKTTENSNNALAAIIIGDTVVSAKGDKKKLETILQALKGQMV